MIFKTYRLAVFPAYFSIYGFQVVTQLKNSFLFFATDEHTVPDCVMQGARRVHLCRSKNSN
jgi:hypothetical protein